MKIKCEKPTITFNSDYTCNLTFKAHKSIVQDLEKIEGEYLDIEIKEWRCSRTISQNSYLWSLLNHLAIKLNDKAESVYKHFVRDYGVREYILVKDESVDELSKRWSNHGIGWFTEILRKGKIDGTTTIILYYGSSTYNTKEMTRLIEAVVESCEENGVPTIPMEQFYNLKNEND